MKTESRLAADEASTALPYAKRHLLPLSRDTKSTRASSTTGQGLRVTVVMLCMNWGGAERIAADMVNRWVGLEWNVNLVLLVNLADWPPFYRLDPRVKITGLDVFGNSKGPIHGGRANLSRLRRLRSAIRATNPDVVVSFLPREITLTVLATRGLGVPVIGCPHSDPSVHDVSRTWEFLRRLAYRRADRMVFQTEDQARQFPRAVRRRARVIPNPVRPAPNPNGSPEFRLERPAILSVGHLVEIKNHKLLLRAFAKAAGRHPEWRLTIVGEGPLRRELEDLARQLGVADRLRMPGLVKDIYSVMRQAEFYVQPSLKEGFSMATCEALSCGLPVVATNCSDGQRTIVRDGIDGILVPNDDAEALTVALGRLMENPEERSRLGRHAPDVVDRFGFEPLMQRWDELLREVAAERDP